MYAWADRFTHDHFFSRDYPEPAVVARLFELLGGEPQPRDELRRRSPLPPEVFDTALEKLWIHGGAEVDSADNVRRGSDAWQAAYEAQRAYKAAQFERMIAYAETPGCRMLALVRHFGDREEARRPCGICDFCDPAGTLAQRFREATAVEAELARRTLAALPRTGWAALGRLYAQVAPAGFSDRRSFEELIAALARARLVEVEEAAFEKDGRWIEYRKVRRTGTAGPEDLGRLRFPAEVEAPRRPGGAKRSRSSTTAARQTAPAGEKAAELLAQSAVGQALRAWRLTEAKRRRVPAFRILSDRALAALAALQPESTGELLEVPGIGLKIVERHGRAILEVIDRAQQNR
jgi:superfamily II DNA helicase RecQ